jgi:hypothetical protein
MSDTRRSRIQEIRSSIEEIKDLVILKETSEELIELLSLDGLDFKLKDYHWGVAMAFYRLGDLDSAIRHAEEALEKAKLLGGGDEEDVSAISGNIVFLRKKRDEKPDAASSDSE